MKINPDVCFYDTCALLVAAKALQGSEEHFFISSITLEELETIKTSVHKDSEIKYQVRALLRFLVNNTDRYTVVLHSHKNERYLKKLGVSISNVSNDLKILSDAIYLDRHVRPDEIVFVTNDLSLKGFANLYFGDGMLQSVEDNCEDEYTGYKTVIATNEELSQFYQDSTVNIFNLKINEYLILKDEENNIVDLRVWTGNEYRHIKTKEFTSSWFGAIKPFKNDVYQRLLFDSLINNKITMIRGKAGSGKTMVSLAYLMHAFETRAIDKIIIFCNVVATADSAKLGFYPGDKNEKLLDSQIGNMLTSKLGGREGLEQLIERGVIELLPFSDIRGYDTSGMRAGVYISEAQNLNRNLMKLALQRIGESCFVIIDGDDETQVDLPAYAGLNNGMKRASKVFRGEDIYGEVKLQNIYRSRISAIADKI